MKQKKINIYVVNSNITKNCELIIVTIKKSRLKTKKQNKNYKERLG